MRSIGHGEPPIGIGCVEGCAVAATVIADGNNESRHPRVHQGVEYPTYVKTNLYVHRPSWEVFELSSCYRPGSKIVSSSGTLPLCLQTSFPPLSKTMNVGTTPP